MKYSLTPIEAALIAEKVDALQKARMAYEDVRASFDRETDTARALNVGERALRAWKASADASADLARAAHEVALGPGWEERLRTGGVEVAARYNEFASKEAGSGSPYTANADADVNPLRGAPMQALPQPEVRRPPSPSVSDGVALESTRARTEASVKGEDGGTVPNPHDPRNHQRLLEAWKCLHGRKPSPSTARK